MLLFGLIVAGVLYIVYRSLFTEPEIRSPLPKQQGVEVIWLTPGKTK
jgi:hypothetical protein